MYSNNNNVRNNNNNDISDDDNDVSDDNNINKMATSKHSNSTYTN